MKKLFTSLMIIATFLSTFATIRFFGVFFTLSDLLFIAAGLALLFQELDHARTDHPLGRMKKLWYVWIVGTALMVIGYLVSEMLMISGDSQVITTTLQYIFVFIYLPLLFRRLDYNEKLESAKAYFLGLACMILIGSLLWLFFKPIYLELANSNILVGRLRVGSFIGSNGIARLVGLAIPLIYIVYISRKITLKTIILLSAIFIIGIALAASWGGTLVASLSIIVLILLLGFYSPKHSWKMIILVAAIIAFIVFVNVYLYSDWSTEFESRIISSFNVGDSEEYGSLELRKELAKEAFSYIEENPIFGIGAGQYVDYSRFDAQAHNSYLLIYVEGGILCFLGLLAILFSSIIYAYRFGYRDKSSPIGVAILASVVIFLLSGFVSNALYPRYTIIPLIIALSLLDGPKYNEQNRMGKQA